MQGTGSGGGLPEHRPSLDDFTAVINRDVAELQKYELALGGPKFDAVRYFHFDGAVQGEKDGAAASYEYAQLLPEETEPGWPFSFRYFQDFNRQVVLPDGFTPQRVKVEVESRTRSIPSIEESFAWTTSQG